MKHNTARKINELFQKHYNVQPDENAFIDTDIIDEYKNIILTAEQYNQLIEPTNNEIYNTACAVIRSYHVALDHTHTLEFFFSKLLAQKNVYVVHLDTDNELLCTLHDTPFISYDLLTAIRISYCHVDPYHNAKHISLALTACVARLIENNNALSFDLSEILSDYLATGKIDDLIISLANF
jgi:hypothetical protein